MSYQLSYHLYKTLKKSTFIKKGTFFIFFKLGLSWGFCLWFQTYFRGSLSDHQRTLCLISREPLRIRGLIWFSEDSSDFQRTHLIFRGGSLWFSEGPHPPKGPDQKLDLIHVHSVTEKMLSLKIRQTMSEMCPKSDRLPLKKCPTNNQTGSNWKVDCSYWKETPLTNTDEALWKSEESSENQMSSDESSDSKRLSENQTKCPLMIRQAPSEICLESDAKNPA